MEGLAAMDGLNELLTSLRMSGSLPPHAAAPQHGAPATGAAAVPAQLALKKSAAGKVQHQASMPLLQPGGRPASVANSDDDALHNSGGSNLVRRSSSPLNGAAQLGGSQDMAATASAATATAAAAVAPSSTGNSSSVPLMGEEGLVDERLASFLGAFGRPGAAPPHNPPNGLYAASTAATSGTTFSRWGTSLSDAMSETEPAAGGRVGSPPVGTFLQSGPVSMQHHQLTPSAYLTNLSLAQGQRGSHQGTSQRISHQGAFVASGNTSSGMQSMRSSASQSQQQQSGPVHEPMPVPSSLPIQSATDPTQAGSLVHLTLAQPGVSHFVLAVRSDQQRPAAAANAGLRALLCARALQGPHPHREGSFAADFGFTPLLDSDGSANVSMLLYKVLVPAAAVAGEPADLLQLASGGGLVTISSDTAPLDAGLQLASMFFNAVAATQQPGAPPTLACAEAAFDATAAQVALQVLATARAQLSSTGHEVTMLLVDMSNALVSPAAASFYRVKVFEAGALLPPSPMSGSGDVVDPQQQQQQQQQQPQHLAMLSAIRHAQGHQPGQHLDGSYAATPVPVPMQMAGRQQRGSGPGSMGSIGSGGSMQSVHLHQLQALPNMAGLSLSHGASGSSSSGGQQPPPSALLQQMQLPALPGNIAANSNLPGRTRKADFVIVTEDTAVKNAAGAIAKVLGRVAVHGHCCPVYVERKTEGFATVVSVAVKAIAVARGYVGNEGTGHEVGFQPFLRCSERTTDLTVLQRYLCESRLLSSLISCGVPAVIKSMENFCVATGNEGTVRSHHAPPMPSVSSPSLLGRGAHGNILGGGGGMINTAVMRSGTVTSLMVSRSNPVDEDGDGSPRQPRSSHNGPAEREIAFDVFKFPALPELPERQNLPVKVTAHSRASVVSNIIIKLVSERDSAVLITAGGRAMHVAMEACISARTRLRSRGTDIMLLPQFVTVDTTSTLGWESVFLRFTIRRWSPSLLSGEQLLAHGGVPEGRITASHYIMVPNAVVQHGLSQLPGSPGTGMPAGMPHAAVGSGAGPNLQGNAAMHAQGMHTMPTMPSGHGMGMAGLQGPCLQAMPAHGAVAMPGAVMQAGPPLGGGMMPGMHPHF